MKLRNKKTGKIVKLDIHCIAGKNYESLAEINEEWEDYEEPKDYWYIRGDDSSIGFSPIGNCEVAKRRKEIGNYFETKEEAEKAVEKLKAWKRLKDYYVKFSLDFVKNTINFTYQLDGTLHSSINEERIIFENMKTIFGDNDESNQ